MLWSEAVHQQLSRISQQGMEQAAAMFSRLLRQPVTLEVVEAWMSDQDAKRSPPEDDGIGVFMAISGELSGGLLLFLGEDCARWLTAKLLRCDSIGALLEEPASSTLKEIGNIISSAFLASLDDQLQLRSLPSPPDLSQGGVTALVARYQHGGSEPSLVVRTRLTAGEQTPPELQGESYLFLSCQAMQQLVARLAGR